MISLVVIGLNLHIGNSFFSASFSDAKATKVIVNGENIVSNLGGKKTFFVGYHKEKFMSFKPDTLKVLEKRDDFAHVAYYQTSNDGISIEQHYIVNVNVSGLYNYVVLKNNAQTIKSVSEIRMLCRFNPQLMPSVHNGKVQMTPKSYEELKKYPEVQDETWHLSDGTYYSKYDLAGYIREINYFGVLGGGIGAWFIHASHEYFSGGPLKQDLLAHQDSLMMTYMTGAHFGTPILEMPAGFSKFYGPWLIYFNQGTDSELIEDVKKQTEIEKSAWPYDWVNDGRYDFIRGSVTGSISGPKCAVVLSSQDEMFDLQVRGYSYDTETNEDGTFSLKNVRPGAYTLSVYPVEGASAGTLLQLKFNVAGGKNYHAGSLKIDEPTDIIWQLGQTNRRSVGVHRDKDRNYGWHLMSPETLTFIVGKSDPTKDWYYAQTKKGTWNVEFKDTNDGNGRFVLLSIAAASWNEPTLNIQDKPVLNVFINGKQLRTLTYANDKAIYRGAMQSGRYHFAKIEVPTNDVLTGTNNLSLELVKGAFMYDTIVYTVAK